MVVTRTVFAALLSGVALGAAAQAQPTPTVQFPKTDVVAPPPLSVQDFVRYPAIASPVLSRNGKFFAATAPINGRMNLVVIDLETRKGNALTNFSNFDVISVNWVGNDRILYTLGQFNTPTGPGQADGGGLFMVTRDGKDGRALSPTTRDCRNRGDLVCRQYELLRTLPDSDTEVIAAGNMRSADSSDVYRLNVATGRATLLTESRPSHVASWVLDRNQVPRIARAWIKDTHQYAIHYRKSASAPWEEIARYDSTVGQAFVPLAFEADNQTLLVATNEGRDTMAVFRYDPNARKLAEVVAQHPRYDMGANAQGERVPGIVRDPVTDNIVGYQVQGDKPEVVWTDDQYARLQRMIDGALPGLVNRFARTPDGDRLLVTSFSDRQPVKWYFLDDKKKTLEEVLSSRPWIRPENLVEMRPFRLKTRDGLEIPSYYFLPRDHKPGQKLPTVLHIHGGPTVRADRWGDFTYGVREAQILASRGYAVVLPNFRGTPGLGSKIYYSAFGAVGRQMSEDHEDAAKWAIEQGFADPARICIVGASYGGYATLMALAKTPDLFRCGIAGLSVSDWELIAESASGDTAYSAAAAAFARKLTGADRNPAAAREVSPVHLAARMKNPLMLWAGADDIRTPIEQTRGMQSALERAGNPPKSVLIKAGEGHGFGAVDNNVELYDAMLKFLEAHIGPKQP
jgi:dipeptidyl aminopeptidase/acylaminoacyl peptidase